MPEQLKKVSLPHELNVLLLSVPSELLGLSPIDSRRRKAECPDSQNKWIVCAAGANDPLASLVAINCV